MILYKTLKKGLKSGYDSMQWRRNQWYKIEGKLGMCNNGFHASKRIVDAMQYVTPAIIARVEVRGDHLEDTNKQCWSEMRIVKTWRWTKKDSVALAIFAAELVIDDFEKEHPDDKYPREVIETAKRWLKNPTKKNLSAVSIAADAMVWSDVKGAAIVELVARIITWPANFAREAVSISMTWAAKAAVKAVRSAACSVACSAEDAEWNEVMDKCEEFIRSRLSIKTEDYQGG